MILPTCDAIREHQDQICMIHTLNLIYWFCELCRELDQTQNCHNKFKTDKVLTKRLTLSMSSEETDLKTLMQTAVDWIAFLACNYVDTYPIESGVKHEYCVEVTVEGNGAEIFTDEPEEVRYVIDPKPALKIICEELRKEILKKL